MDIKTRIAQNEALFREVNDRIADHGERHGHAGFVCECGEAECAQIINLTTATYAAVREDPHWFFVLPGHEVPVAERVVARYPTHIVVEKKGAARAVAEATDPNAS